MPKVLLALVLSCLVGGCMKPLEEQVKKSPNSIMNKKTRDIGKFDPATMTELETVDSPATNPVTAPLEMYGPIVIKTSKMAVDNRLVMFNVMHERFPTYDEFMAEIVNGPEGLELPVLPGKQRYMYHEAEHRLVVVGPAPEGEAAAGVAASTGAPAAAPDTTPAPTAPTTTP